MWWLHITRRKWYCRPKSSFWAVALHKRISFNSWEYGSQIYFSPSCILPLGPCFYQCCIDFFNFSPLLFSLPILSSSFLFFSQFNSYRDIVIIFQNFPKLSFNMLILVNFSRYSGGFTLKLKDVTDPAPFLSSSSTIR